MIDIQGYLYGLAATAAAGFFFRWLAGAAPGFLTARAQALYLLARESPWWRDPAHPHRARLLLALVELLEAEIPNPGEGKAFYARLGEALAGLPARLSVKAPAFLKPPLLALAALMIGTGPKWAAVLEKTGDALDTQLDGELKELAAAQVLPLRAPGEQSP